jgi:hypothetical protein
MSGMTKEGGDEEAQQPPSHDSWPAPFMLLDHVLSASAG